MAQNNTSLEKKVREAILKLTNEGQEITNEAVRKAIGGGSFRDVAPLVKAAKAELAAKEQAARAAPEMPEDFHDAAAAMWHMSWQLADEIAASERRAHSAEIEKLKAEADEALSNCALVEDERDEADARAQAVTEQLEEAKKVLNEAHLEIARLNGRLMERQAGIVSRTKQPKPRRPPTKTGPEEPVSASDMQDDAQQDMFPQEETELRNSDDPDAIAAE